MLRLLLAAIPVIYAIARLARRPLRLGKISPIAERVLILGASSGIGAAIATEYAARGARVCIVGRRREMLDGMLDKMVALYAKNGHASADEGEKRRLFCVTADFASVEDMVSLRGEVENEWAGIDTLIVAAGVSALQPLMAVAGVEGTPDGRTFTPAQASLSGIQRAVDIANAATRGNFTGPLVAAVTLIPLLSSTSRAPAVLLVSTVGAVIPAPTRSLYASTKAASLVLYQALAIEHPAIAFTFLLPGTVEGDFRASAVDAGPVREANPNVHGLKRGVVAARAVRAVDASERTVWMGGGGTYRIGHMLYWVWPRFVEWRARVKYGWKA